MFNLLSKANQSPKNPEKSKLKPGRIKKIKFPGAVYVSGGTPGIAHNTRGLFQESEYDLSEIAKVMDIESYVRQAFGMHTELCLKEGYQIKSRNTEATSYVKRRLREIGEVSDRSFDSLLRGIVSNLVSFSNCFIVKARNPNSSSGLVRTTASGKVLEPVAGYFILDPTSIRILRDIHGKVLKYKQHIPNVAHFPTFNAEDVIHIFYGRKEGFAFGTPYIVPALDDIRSLRRMEENIEMLMLSHLYPLYQYIVGTEEHPAEIYEDGTTEVDIIKQEIENMPTEGSIVTPERHKIEVLGAQGKAIQADPYLRHFELRVLAGLGVSEISLGRGGTANRSTASVIDKGMTDRCKDFQFVIENFVNEYIMKELLLEGGFDTFEEEEDTVSLQFNEIDLDSLIKIENHSVFKYEHDIITEAETRELIGKDPITEEQRNDMFFEHVTKPKAIIMAVDEPYTAEAKGAAIQKVSKEEKKKRETTEREQPSNQHGRKIAKTTTKKDELLKDAAEELKKITDNGSIDLDIKNISEKDIVNVSDVFNVDNFIKDLRYHWNITKEDVFDYVKQVYIEEHKNLRDFKPEKLKMILFLTKDSIVKRSGIYVFRALKEGIKKGALDCGREEINLNIDSSAKYQYLNERIEYYTTSLLSDLGTQLVRHINPDFADGKNKNNKENIIPKIAGVFDALDYRLRFTAHTEVMKAFNFGYALAVRDSGYKEVYLKLSNNPCSKCVEASDKPLSLEYFSFEDIAPIHPMCNCTYKTKE